MGAISMKWRDNRDKRGSADEVLWEWNSGIGDDVFVESRLDSSINRLRIQSTETVYSAVGRSQFDTIIEPR